MTDIIVVERNLPATSAAVQTAVGLWASATTNAESQRYHDMLRDKSSAVSEFFAFAGKRPPEVRPEDVARWVEDMRGRDLSAATIYARTSMLSSFYSWLMEDDMFRASIPFNPVGLARPKAPKAYRNAKSLSDDELSALLATVRHEAEDGRLTAKRDYAMLLFYVLTGHRRAEVVRLTWGDLKKNGTLQVHFLVKGGDYVQEEVSLLCWDALGDYLDAAGRLDSMTAESPLWVGHDSAGQATGTLSSHAFAKNLKRYARDAGLDGIHVHQLRHTVARLVGDESGDLTKVQRVLGHKNLQTTRVYLSRVAVKKDDHSAGIAKRLGL